MPKKLILTKDKSIQKKEYTNIDEYRYDKKTDLVPKKNNRLLCVILCRDKKVRWVYRPIKDKNITDSFHFRRGLYFIDPDGIHVSDNGVMASVYIEGLPLPLKESYIEYETKTVTYTSFTGEVKTSVVRVIKGILCDAKILHTFINEEFARIFSKSQMDKWALFCLIFGIISCVMIGICIGVSYFYR